jgi:hypothetical protein
MYDNVCGRTCTMDSIYNYEYSSDLEDINLNRLIQLHVP